MNIIFPKLNEWQQDVFDSIGDPYKTGKIYVIKAKRQIGKSIIAILEMLKMAIEHPGCTSVIVEPSLQQSRRVFKQINKFLRGCSFLKSANNSLMTIEFSNGSEILFKSAQQDDNLRGFTVSGILIIDEAAYISDEIIDLLLPTVDANNAPIMFISTPLFQSGYFYKMYMDGLNNSSYAITYDWTKYDTSKYLSKEKLDYYRSVVSRQKFQSEYLGQFISDDGLLFTNIFNCINNNITKSLSDTKYVYIGIDFGTGSNQDYTVISAFNQNGDQILLERTNNLTPVKQVDYLAKIINELNSKYTIIEILAEQNSIGKVYIDLLKSKIDKTITLTNWNTTNQSKQDLVTEFQLALEKNTIKLLNNSILLDELRKYTATVNEKTKSISYNGVQGSHDDTVIASMLSYYSYKTKTNGKKIRVSFL